MSTRTSTSTRISGPGRALGLLSLLLVALLGLLNVAGAAQADGADGNTPPGKAWVRAGHFATGLGPVDVRLDPRSGSGMALAQQVAYGSMSAYRQIQPGTYTVSIRPSGSAADSTAMLRRTLTVSAGKASTVALLGNASSPRLATLSDDLTPPAAGTARVRVLSGSANAPAVSVMAVNGPTIATDVVLGQTTGYRSVPQGAWTISLNGGAGSVRQTVSLMSGGVYTAVVLDGSTDGVRLSLVTDAQGVSATPQGPAATGFGGAAHPHQGGAPSAGLLAVLAAGLLGAAGVVGARRRSRGPARLR